ncbi:hypothetical protein BH11MYX2_BH11MYX2_38740 [soil metagenome]
MIVSSRQGMTAVTLYLKGREAWPQIVVDDAAFTAAVHRASEPMDGPELYIACACATGNATAIRAFEARYFTCIPGVAKRLSLSSDDASEIAQTLRQRLFVSQDGKPADVIEYAGAGRLAGLVQVAATRIGLNLRRGRKRIADGVLPDAPTVANDTMYAKAEYRDHIKTALEGAATKLEARDRTLLRLHFVDRASIDDVATLYRVHRATAARWISAARDALVAHTRQHFLAATKLDAGDDAGLASFVESQLSLSLSRILS